MIGLIALAALSFWLFAAIKLSQKIPGWLGLAEAVAGVSVSLLIFPLVLLAPIADELIGRWQFSRLCEREAVATLSPDWEQVKRAGQRDTSFVTLDWYFIRIISQREEYFDINTGKNFLTNQAFTAYGGFLAYRMGLALGGSTACSPKGDNNSYKQVNLHELIKQGKSTPALETLEDQIRALQKIQH